MSLPRRLALLEWARKSNALIFEDDYDSEYRYAGRPVPAMQGLDRNGLVLFAGSFSKVLFPSLRLGYLVIPPDLGELFGSGEVGDQSARAFARTGSAVRLHHLRTFWAALAENATSVCGAIVSLVGPRREKFGRVAGNLKS
jgi:aspartate/methionine/tyrosine aminotransferase